MKEAVHTCWNLHGGQRLKAVHVVVVRLHGGSVAPGCAHTRSAGDGAEIGVCVCAYSCLE